MTGSPFGISANPFNKKIVDFTHQYNVEESVILVEYNSDYKTADYYIFDIFNKLSVLIFLMLFATLITLTILINDQYIIRKVSLFENIYSLCFQLLGNLLYMGKHQDFNFILMK